MSRPVTEYLVQPLQELDRPVGKTHEEESWSCVIRLAWQIGEGDGAWYGMIIVICSGEGSSGSLSLSADSFSMGLSYYT